MTYGNAPAGVTTGATEHEAVSTSDDTTTFTEVDLETPFLRALLALPAQRALAVLDGLELHDIHHPHHRVVLDAVVRCARKQVTDGDVNQPVPPTVVQLDLTRTGDFDHPDVRTVLLSITAGVNPVSECWVIDLAVGLRLHRLRRACLAVGETLIQAGRTGGNGDLAHALAHLPRLLVLACRAGIDLVEAQR